MKKEKCFEKHYRRGDHFERIELYTLHFLNEVCENFAPDL